MHNAFPIADIPGQRSIRVPLLDPDTIVTCPRCAGEARLTPDTCHCGYIVLAWVSFPSESGNVKYVLGLQEENALLKAQVAARDQLRETPMLTTDPPPETGTTERGFHWVEFQDLNDRACSLQESSLATDEAIWLGLAGVGNRMHLNRGQVAALLPYLTRFAETGELISE